MKMVTRTQLLRGSVYAVTAAGCFFLAWDSYPLLFGAASFSLAWAGTSAFALAVLAHLCGHALRAEKMVLLLKPLHPNSRFTVYRCLAIGLLFNAILPFRVGELVRAHLLGTSLNISRTAALMTIVFERIVDASMLGLVLIGIAALRTDEAYLLVIGIPMLLLASVLTFGLASLTRPSQWLLTAVYHSTAVLNDRYRDRIRYSIWSGIRFLQLVKRLGDWITYALLSLVMWIVYVAAVAILVNAVGGFDAVRSALFAIFSYVSASAPLGPANFGYYDAIFNLLAGRFTTDKAMIAQIAAATWLLLILPTSFVALTFLFSPAPKPQAQSRVIPAEIDKLMRHERMSAEFGAFLEDYFDRSSLSHILNSMEESGECRNLKVFSGGSLAMTAMIEVQGAPRVRKMALLQHADKLEAQRQWLEKYRQHDWFPKVLDTFSTARASGFDLQFDKEYRPFFEQLHHVHPARSVARLDSIIDAMRSSVYLSPTPVQRPDAIQEYIRIKVVQKIADAASMDPQIDALLKFETLTVNGIRYANFSGVIERILSDASIMDELSRYDETEIHGDLTIDNILVSDQGFLVLDPNNENTISDMIVDVAKLYQSLHSGYEFLRELDEATVAANTVYFVEQKSHQYQQLFDGLERRMASELPPHRYRALLFHEAVHYCRMLTYRPALNPKTSAAFFAVAVRLFNQFIGQYADTKQPA